MAPTKGEVVLLEDVETTTDSTTPPDRHGYITRGGQDGVTQPWRMSGNALVQRALSKDWLLLQGVPNMRSRWIAIHYGQDAMPSPVV